jgi:hypothetical protein
VEAPPPVSDSDGKGRVGVITHRKTPKEALAVQIADLESRSRAAEKQGCEVEALSLKADALLLEAQIELGMDMYGRAIELEMEAARLRLRAIDLSLGRVG